MTFSNNTMPDSQTKFLNQTNTHTLAKEMEFTMNTIKKTIYFTLLFCIQQQLFAQNILITNSGNPCEPAILFDPNDPDNIVAGSNLNFYYTSNDGGLTWTNNTLTSSYGVWGDPVIDIDTAGHFYFFHLSNTPGGNWIDRIVCQKSFDNGNTWTDGSFTGLNGAKAQDKQWSIVDPVDNTIYLTWTEFDMYGSSNPADSSRIMFSKSVDAGITWTTAKKINIVNGDCIDEDNTVEGAVPALGPNGELYVTWAGPNGLVFNRSLDQGDTWLSQEIFVDSMPGGWDFDIPGIDRSNGLPITKCDVSGGPNTGTIYVNWADQRNGTDDTDIWLKKSTDGGNTWSAPVRVNNDTTQRHQFFTWMDIDQTNGNLFFVFYDRRAYADNRTDVYLAMSTDGGNTFINRKISESPFTPTPGVFFGDYNNIVAHNDIVRPIWTRHDGAELSIWTDVTPLSQIIINTPQEIASKDKDEAKVFPIPAPNVSYVSFKLHEQSEIRLELFDQLGKLKATILDNKTMDYGKHIIPVYLDQLNLAAGNYYYQLSINEKTKTLKTIVLD